MSMTWFSAINLLDIDIPNKSRSFLTLHAIAIERSCRRMASVCLSVCNVGELWSRTLS